MPEWDQFRDAGSSDPWSQFKDAEPSVTDDPWAQFQDAPSEDAAGKPSGIPLNIAAGANELIATALGAPVDAINYAMHHNPIEVGVNAVSNVLGYGDVLDDTSRPMIEKPAGGSQWIKENLMGVIGANPADVVAATPGERIARNVGSGVASVLLPGGAVGGMARGMAIGAGAGAGMGIAQEVVPEPYKPLAAILGGAAGGGSTAGAMAGAQAAGRGVSRVVDSVADVARPLTKSGQERLAGERIAGAATDPAALRAALDSPQPELVPGSRPTTFQQTGDLGIGGLENQMRNRGNAPFLEREAQQNQARTSAMDQLQPTGDPTTLSGYIRDRLRWLDEQTRADVDDATNFARQRSEQIGGTRQLEEYGQGLRSGLREAQRRAKLAERQLWDAVDPDGSITVNPSPVTAAARDIRGSIEQSARPMAGEEAAIFQALDSFGQAIPFRELVALRTRVNSALRAERRGAGDAATLARLSRLRDGIENATTAVVEQRVAAAPEILDGIARLEQILRAETSGWQASRRSGSQGLAASDSSGASRVFAVPGGQVPDRRGFRNPPGDQGLPGQPTFDTAAQERLAAATTATRERSDIFGRGPVGQVLRTGDRADLFRVSDADVPKRLFRPGNAGAEDVRSFRRAVPEDDAFGQLQDYAASDLRRLATGPDGVLDPRKVREWVRRHQSALSEFPPEFRERITNAQTAGEVIADAAVARRRIMNEAEDNGFAKLAGLDNADDVQRAIGSVLSSGGRVVQMQALARVTATNPSARQGLRRAVAQFMARKLIGNTEAGASGTPLLRSDQFQTFVRENSEALSAIFSPDEIRSLQNIASDLQRSNRNVRVRGQSATAQNTLGKVGGNSMLDEAVRRYGQPFAAGTVGAGVGTAVAGPVVGAPAGFVAGFMAALKREAGIDRIDELVTKALLDPELAKALLAKVPPSAGSPAARSAMDAIKRASLWGAGVGTMTQVSQPSVAIGAPIDTSRPMLDNTDGSFSTERTIGIRADLGEGERSYLIPTIVNGERLNPDAAIQRFFQGSNPPVGVFSTDAEANAAAQRRSQAIGDARALERAAPPKPQLPSLRDLLKDKRPLPQIQRQMAAAERAAAPKDGSRRLPAPADDPAAMERARQRVTPLPSGAQKEAGNYAKGRVRFNGLNITIETPRGAERTGIAKGGEPWSSRMPANTDYGYITGYGNGADKQPIDVYLGPATNSQQAFIIDQVDPESRAFDEHKVMLGYRGQREAEAAYAQSFGDGKGAQRIGGISSMSVGALKALLESGAFSKRLPRDPIGVAAQKQDRKQKEPPGRSFEELTGQIARGRIPRVGAQ